MSTVLHSLGFCGVRAIFSIHFFVRENRRKLWGFFFWIYFCFRSCSKKHFFFGFCFRKHFFGLFLVLKIMKFFFYEFLFSIKFRRTLNFFYLWWKIVTVFGGELNLLLFSVTFLHIKYKNTQIHTLAATFSNSATTKETFFRIQRKIIFSSVHFRCTFHCTIFFVALFSNYFFIYLFEHDIFAFESRRKKLLSRPCDKGGGGDSL